MTKLSMLKNRYKEKGNVIEIIIPCILLVIVFVISIGWATFSQKLEIDGIEATVRIQADIRITGISASVDNNFNNNGAISNWEEYNVKHIQTSVNLPNANSQIKYKVQITNFGNAEMGILNITGLPEYLEYEIEEYKLKEKICVDDRSENKCKLGIQKDIYIIIKYKDGVKSTDDITHIIDLDLDFKSFHKITYEGFSFDTSSYPQEIIDGDDLNITLSGNITVSNSNGNLIEGEDYTYINNQLKISSVTSDIEIKSVRIRAGTYIAYTPEDNGSYITTAAQNGMMDQEFTQDKSIGWRIWDIDDEKITLISSEIPYLDDYYNYLTLFGADGYNNAVKILNSMAEKLYSNESLGAKARSINMDDIDKVSTFDKETFVDAFNHNYGMEFKIENAYYPNIYSHVPGTYINGVPVSGILDRSTQETWYFGEETADELKGLYTYYTYSTRQYTREPYSSMLNFADKEVSYWIASRNVIYGYGNSTAFFSIFWMEYDGNIGPAMLHAANGEDTPYFGPIRPMVEIPLSGLTIGLEGDGTINNPYSISKN